MGRRIALVVTAVAIAVAGCAGGAKPSAPPSSSPVSSVAAATAAPRNGAGCGRIGVFLPNTTDSRWQALDAPALRSSIAAAIPGSTVDEQNANGDAAVQLQQAQAGLAAGDCILVVAPVDATQAAQIVTAAVARTVPVIAYDSVIESRETPYFVGFDEVGVGELIGQYVVDHYSSYLQGSNRNVALIDSDQRDPRSILIHQGESQRLQPIFDAQTLRKVYDQFTPGGDADTARTETEGILTATSNNVQVVVDASDALAAGSIGALTAHRLNGKVLVTAAGASVQGIHSVLTGDQAMTVELNPKVEAGGAARLAAALVAGSGAARIATATTTTAGGASIPSLLEVPVAIDKTNVAKVIADGLVTVAQVCTGIPAGTAGVC